MSDIFSQKISELQSSTGPSENAYFPLSEANSDFSEKVSVATLRETIGFENAFPTIAIALLATKESDVFFVYEDDKKENVLGYVNQGNGNYSALMTDSNTQLRYATSSFVVNSLFFLRGAESFEELRTINPWYEGQRIKLKSYYVNGLTGGGEFIGHLGAATDDDGVIAAGEGYYWERILNEPVIYPEHFGADTALLDNNTALSKTFNYAIANKKSVCIKANINVSTLPISGFNFTIFGPGTMTFSNPNGFVISNGNGGVIDGLTLIFSGVGSTGITVTGSNNIVVRNCTISNHGRNGGVYILNSTNVMVSKNTFLNAAGDATFGSSTTADVNIWGTNSGCSVVDNRFISGGGYGIQIRSHALGDVSANHVISRNFIDGYNSYGINCYRNKQSLTDTQVLKNVIVSENVISNISGNRPSNPATPDVLIFGTGIYMQGSEMSTVVNNTITNVCTNSNNDLLAPAGIGITNIGNINIANNTIVNSGMYGIKVNDSVGLGDVYGRVIVESNIIDTVGTDGIMVQDRNNISVTNNSIKGASRDGIKINTSPSSQTKVVSTDKKISFNSLKTIAGIGIYIEYSQSWSIESNCVTDCAQGLVFQYSAYGRVIGNTIDNASTRGYYAHVTNTAPGSIIFTENKCLNTTTQIAVEHPIDYYNNPQMTPTGTYANAREITADLPNVTGCEVLNLKPTAAMNLTGFAGGKIGQRITIWVNNALVTMVQSGSFILAGLKNRNPGYNSAVTFVKTKAGWVEVAQSGYAVAYINPTSGSSVTISDYTGGIYIQGSSALASLSVTLPASPVDDQVCTICSQSGVTALTLTANTGQSIFPPTTPTALSAGISIQYRYRAVANGWFRYQ